MAGWVLLPPDLVPVEEADSLRVCVQRPVNAAREVASRVLRTTVGSLRCQS